MYPEEDREGDRGFPCRREKVTKNIASYMVQSENKDCCGCAAALVFLFALCYSMCTRKLFAFLDLFCNGG